MLLLSLFLWSYIYCSSGEKPANPALPYQSNVPDKTLDMPKELEEISGLSLSDDGKYLLAVQDEKGIVFYLDKNTGAVVREVKFWEDGDFEGIEAVGKDVYVVKSSGTIYQVSNEGKDIQKYKLGLSSENDVEGLAYDAKNNRLLLACKAQAGKGAEYHQKRGIYAFDLDKKTLSTEPVLMIDGKEVQEYLQKMDPSDDLTKLLEAFSSDKEDLSFAPSAIAIHPKTGDWYILSSASKMILVLNPEGKIQYIEKLKKKIHAQPEGICFDTDGTMYISNEGRGGEPGKVYVFKVKG